MLRIPTVDLYFLLIIGIIGLKLSTTDDVMNANFAFAQNVSNVSSLVISSSGEKMEVALKNQESGSFWNSPLAIGAIGASSGIVGGLLGSYMTYRSNRQMEDRRNTAQRDRDHYIATNVRE